MRALFVPSLLGFIIVSLTFAQPRTPFQAANIVRSIAVEKQNTWVGTDAGVFVCDKQGTVIQNFSKEDGLASNKIVSIALTSTGAVWFSCLGNGVTQKMVDQWKTYTGLDGLASNYIRSIIVDKKDQVWCATEYHGVSMFNGTTWTCYDSTKGLADNFIWAMAVDANNRLYCGTNRGLSILEGGTWSTLDQAQGLPAGSIRALSVDPQGSVVLGTDRGVYSLKNGRIKSLAAPADVTSQRVSSLVIDAKETLWALWGTARKGQLYALTGGTWQRFGTNQGLTADHITVMGTNIEDAFICGSYKGMFSCNPTTENKSFSQTLFVE